MESCHYISIVIIHKLYEKCRATAGWSLTLRDFFVWKVETMINGDIIMAATTVAPAEEQTHGAPLRALGFLRASATLLPLFSWSDVIQETFDLSGTNDNIWTDWNQAWTETSIIKGVKIKHSLKG